MGRTTPRSPHSGLPPELRRILEALLAGPEKQVEAAIEKLCALHPLYADSMRRVARGDSVLAPTTQPTPRSRPEGVPKPAVLPSTKAPTNGTSTNGSTKNGAGTHDSTENGANKNEWIGSYRLLECLGEGGMGTVYLAEQREPVHRRVALKLIKLGMDSQDVLARFKLEERALAAMNHNCIAKVLDAGTTERGQPFFAMEFVEGIPLDRYCDKHRLSLKERIAVFQRICAGVQHAHQKGVIHRDLKPGNILVQREGNRPVPKIIDFGLARATNKDLLGQSIHTEIGTFLGTREYMAPEQARHDTEGIDTRADIYSLGVILYELLTGELPFSAQELSKGGDLEFLRKITEVDPVMPSTKIGRCSKETAEDHASRRRTLGATLTRKLRGDLDWIVMMAIAKEPERRYETANGLAMDLTRYLALEPVLAGPPSTSYRIKKMIRRHRSQFAAAACIFLSLLVGVVAFYTKWIEADELAKSEEIAKTEANQQRQRAETTLGKFQMVSSKRRLDRAREREKDLYPAWPGKLDLMKAWLVGDIHRVLEKQDSIRATLAELEDRALPLTEEDRLQNRLQHSLYPRLVRIGAQISSLEKAQDVREGGTWPEDFPLDASLLPRNPSELIRYARPRVDLERKSFGDEAMALAYCRRARNQLGDRAGAAALEALALALHANGLDEQARQAAEESVQAATPAQRSQYLASGNQLVASIARMQGESGSRVIADLLREIDDIEEEISKRRIWSFADPAEGFLHDTLEPLIEEISHYRDHEVVWVTERIAWAERVHELSVDAQRAQWDMVRDQVRTGYGLDLKPQIGLVPLGRDPGSGLFEFYHLRSAEDATQVPIRDPASQLIEMQPGMGMIFVLLPGGDFTMGPRSSTEDGDLSAAPKGEFPHQVTLGPFFLSKYEMTQAQWQRLNHDRNPSFFKAEGLDTNPVDTVNWEMAARLMRQQGLVLPTEAQWEYACRAGTDTTWSFGNDPSLMVKYGNSADLSLKATGLDGDFAPFDDSYPYQAPVGSFLPNPFGFYDMHGNVYEWCQDWSGNYLLPVQEGNGLRLVPTELQTRKILRGGSFYNASTNLGSASHFVLKPKNAEFNHGLRPARAIYGLPAK